MTNAQKPHGFAAAQIKRWIPVLRLLLGVGMVIYVFSRFIPCVPANDYPLPDDMDDSWTQALHWAFVKHWQFGTDLVFTYGPWGFLARGYLPETYLVAVAAWTVLTTIYLCAGWRVARHYSTHWLAAGLWLTAFTAATSIPVGEDFNTRLVAWCVLLLLLHFFVEERATSPLQSCLAVTLGWLGLVKFTGLVEGMMVVLIIAADNVFRQRRFPWVVVSWLAGFLFFWIAAGQHLSSLPPFWRNSWQIAGGYTEAMMTGQETIRVAYFLGLGLGACALVGLLAWRRLRFFGLLPLTGMVVILFFAFKLGYVRNDVKHETGSALALAVVSMACLAVAGVRATRLTGAAAGLLALTMLFATNVFHAWLPDNGLGRQITGTFSPYNLFAPAAANASGYLEKEYDQRKASKRKQLSLPKLEGNADIYSYDQNALFAQALPYQPRPILQSYSAYTPELAEMNAAHLRTAQAADNILLAIEPINGRFPALDDGRSWPELLTRYDVKGPADAGGDFLLLARAATPRQFHLVPIANAVAHFGETVSLPAASNGPVWVEIGIEKTFTGRLITMLYKPAVLKLTVSLGDHTQRRFQLIPGMASGGFLLSPLITDAHAFAALAKGGAQGVDAKWKVESMTISAETKSSSTGDYKPLMPVRFYRLDYPLQ